jgi:drug/metabolite transporter (DMT)-like permease
MLYLVATILLNVVNSAIFKLFPKYGINTFQAIVANYIVCVITGSLFIGHIPFTMAAVHSGWFPWALVMGAGFIIVFNLLAYSTKVDGITTTIIASKLSLVIPALLSVWLYKEQVGVGKVAGIILAFPAIYLATRIKGEKQPQNLLLPILIFIGGGLLDSLTKYVQTYFLATQEEQAQYAIYCFATAATLGVLVLSVLLALMKKTFSWRNVVAGICLGIPNYFSIYFLIRMLNSNFLQSSAAIPVLNIGILVASAITAILLFREKANMARVAGLLLSIVAILLIAFGDRH